MNPTDLEKLKGVVERSRLTPRMLADAFGYDSADALNSAFAEAFGESIEAYRERTQPAPQPPTVADSPF